MSLGLLERLVRLGWRDLVGDVSLTINHILISVLFEPEIISQANRRQTCVELCVSVWVRIGVGVMWGCPGIGSILVEGTDHAHVGVHVVSDMVLVLLPLVLELPGHFFSEDSHVLLDSFLDLLLNEESNFLAHVVGDFLKLGIVLSTEDVGLELTVCTWVKHDLFVLVHNTTRHFQFSKNIL